MVKFLNRLSVNKKVCLIVSFSGILAYATAQNSFSEQTVTIGEDDFLPYCKGEIIKHISGEKALMMEKISDVIMSWDSLNPPQGFETSFYSGNSSLDITFAAYINEGGMKRTKSGAQLSIGINDPIKIFGTAVTDNIFLRPEKVAGFFGFPVYMNTDHEVTVITKNNTPLFVPVTREEYLKQLIRTEEQKQQNETGIQQKSDSELILVEMEKSYKELLKTDPDVASEFKTEIQKFRDDMKENQNTDVPAGYLSSLKEELKNLSPADRIKPAWYSIGAMEKYGNLSGLVTGSNGEEGTALVRMAPAYSGLINNENIIKLLVIKWNVGSDNSISDKPRLYEGGAKGFLLADYYMARIYHQQKIWNNIIKLVQ